MPYPHPRKVCLVRFTAPEFTSLCPITGQPDFAHLVLDYVPRRWLIESKSFKLYLQSFRNHGAFHEDCTLAIAGRLVDFLAPRWLRIGGYWYPRGGIPIDVFWQTGRTPTGLWIPEQGVRRIAGADESDDQLYPEGCGIHDRARGAAAAARGSRRPSRRRDDTGGVRVIVFHGGLGEDSAATVAPSAAKAAVISSVDRHRPELVSLSDQIWAFAEIALREHRSAKLLADYVEKQGFRVERGIAGMPTAFLASYGNGRPVIGIMGEYDALPGLSQKAQPSKEPLVAGAGGHGCGHNMFGAASLGAALAIREQIQSGALKGTILFYGTPAEEDIGGKTYMARDGVFNDVDVMLTWHPGDETQADTDSSQAMVDLAIEFHGRAAHAANDPWNGRSAVDALEVFTHGVNLMREHIKPTSRLHYTIANGGDVPNVVPEYAKVWLWARDWERAEVERLLARIRKLAEGAAIMTETTSTVRCRPGAGRCCPTSLVRGCWTRTCDGSAR